MSQLTIETFSPQPEDVAKLNQWMFETIQPYIKGRTLEIGSGSGAFSSLLLHDNARLYLNNLDKPGRDNLRDKFKAAVGLREVSKIDFTLPTFHQAYAHIFGIFSTIVSLNFPEQGYLDKTQLANAQKLLRDRGNLITILPSNTVFLSGWDQDIEEMRRYDRKPLKQLLSNFEILKKRYFNFEEKTLILIIASKNLD